MGGEPAGATFSPIKVFPGSHFARFRVNQREEISLFGKRMEPHR
jgi:hypothetical protein